jgi:poly(3-hydroxybutyrate) depolymerase
LQPYRLFIPDSYDGSKPIAMVVALHGMGGDENGMFDAYGKELPVDAQAHGFIVAAPKGREPASMCWTPWLKWSAITRWTGRECT